MSVMPSLQGVRKNPDGSYTVTDKREPYGKVTGTSISAVIGKNPWQTPFSSAVRMLRLFNEDISDKPSIHAGVVMEPKILDHFGAIHGDEIFAVRSGDHETWASDFDDEIFGGHIDGLMPDGAVVEVKTSSRPQDWDNAIPYHYHLQASLYAHFLKTDRIVFLVGFTDRETLANPDVWVPSKDNCIRVDCGIADGFDGILGDARDFYESTVLKDTTPVPDMSNPIDEMLVQYLDAQLWNDEEVLDAVNGIDDLNQRIQELTALQDELAMKKEILSLYMDYNHVDEVDGNSVVIERSLRSKQSIDAQLLKRDGLYDMYCKRTEYKTMRIKKR